VNCRFCGTALPEGALFCGECGRPVPEAAARPAKLPASTRPAMPEIRFSPESESDPEPLPRTVTVVESEYTCPQCGEPIDEDDVFCGECGFVLSSSYLSAAEDLPDGQWPFAESPASEEEPPEPESQPRKDTDMPENEQQEEQLAPAGARSRTIPDPFPWGADLDDEEDVEATRLVPAGGGGDRFVLQFSTGESVTVSGAGLVGRNPVAEPGEYFDHAVPIADPGKSVSKTHLEFGQDDGVFWVLDRFSGNGTVLREPGAEPRYCEPGRRYRVSRGGRVDIGDQFFIVS